MLKLPMLLVAALLMAHGSCGGKDCDESEAVETARGHHGDADDHDDDDDDDACPGEAGGGADGGAGSGGGTPQVE